MKYASGIREFIDRCDAAMPPDFYKQPLEHQRALYLGLTKVFPYTMPPGVNHKEVIIEHAGRSIAARLYRPDQLVDDGLVIYLRGGGFVVGSLETHNALCAELCANTGLTTIAIDFRMAPENPFPAGLEDCYAALCGIAARPDQLGVDPSKIVIAGDSSGANMAVAIAMMARDRSGPKFSGQSLISPVLDFTRWRSGGDDAPLLTSGEMQYYTACYLPDAALADEPYVSPLVRGRFDGLPPAYVMGAELDSLLVDARTYARRLQDHGIPVTLSEEPGLVHSAMRARGLSPQVADAWRRYGAATARLAVPANKVSSVPAFVTARPVVIVHPYSSGATYAPTFVDAGVPVVALVAPTTPDVYAASYRPGDFHKIIVAEDDIRRTMAQLQDLHPRCILAGCESGVELAERIASHVLPELSNRSENAASRRHKGAMAAAVAQAGLPVIEQICTDDPAVVEAWIKRTGLAGRDLVIKPSKSASTDGVTRVPCGNGWQQVFLDLLGKKNRLGIRNNDLIVQEYCIGTEYVVDTASWDGQHSVCDVCRYHKIDNGEYMAVYESMDWMPPQFPGYDELVAYTRAVLDAVGVRYGAAHAEIMLTERGPRLIEVAARPHGGGHPRFCRVATRDSQVDRVVRRLASGMLMPEGYSLDQNVRVVFLIAKRAGCVGNAEVLDGIKRLPSHHFSKIAIHNGMWVAPTRDLFGSLDLGFVVLAHKDLAQLEADTLRVRELEAQVELSD